MKICVIIPAAGQGKRFGRDAAGRSKLEIDLRGRPVFLRAAEAFVDRPEVVKIILAVDPDGLDEFKFKWGDQLSFRGMQVVAGGRKERWQTVMRALEAVEPDCTHIAIHDAARPLVSRALIDRVFDAAQRFAAVIPAVPVSATLKRVVDADGADDAEPDPIDAILGTAGKDVTVVQRVTETIDRSSLVEVQTPQVFDADLLRRAYAELEERAEQAGGVTDDAALIEALGEPVHVVEGEVTNLKITQRADIDLVRAVLSLTSKQDAQ